MKIKCYRFPCEVCGDNKVVCSIQVFFRKNGEVSYARARHFGADKKFYYHQQSLESVNNKLEELAIIDPCQASKNRTFEQIKPNSNSITKLMAGGEGFELGRSVDITCKTIFSLRILGKEIVMLYAKMR